MVLCSSNLNNLEKLKFERESVLIPGKKRLNGIINVDMRDYMLLLRSVEVETDFNLPIWSSHENYV